jgi:hypothetical protein
MTCSKLAAAMAAGFVMGQAFGPCDALPDLLRCGCEDTAATGAESAPVRLPDGWVMHSHGRRSIRRGGPGAPLRPVRGRTG